MNAEVGNYSVDVAPDELTTVFAGAATEVGTVAMHHDADYVVDFSTHNGQLASWKSHVAVRVPDYRDDIASFHLIASEFGERVSCAARFADGRDQEMSWVRRPGESGVLTVVRGLMGVVVGTGQRLSDEPPAWALHAGGAGASLQETMFLETQHLLPVAADLLKLFGETIMRAGTGQLIESQLSLKFHSPNMLYRANSWPGASRITFQHDSPADHTRRSFAMSFSPAGTAPGGWEPVSKVRAGLTVVSTDVVPNVSQRHLLKQLGAEMCLVSTEHQLRDEQHTETRPVHGGSFMELARIAVSAVQ